ncbi:MAG TPA: hypothetical protein VL551_31970 [Actinospica sp.]|jgi:hypothetical protein|nr:hypothetical protein [Actinospica sp.]
MDVENLDALNPAELDELLERALNPQVPVELLYAVLERIGPAADPRGKGPLPPSSPDTEQTTVMPPLAMAPQPPRGAATDRAVRPERPKQQPPSPNAKQQGAPPQKPATSQLGPLNHPKPASAAAQPSRGAHAPSRRVAPPPGEPKN